MKIIMVTRDRPELTRQTIETMEANAANWAKHTLIVLFDCTLDEIVQTFPEDIRTSHGNTLVCTQKQLGVGGAKNYGVNLFETRVGWHDLNDDDILMFSDNDMYYLPNWDVRLQSMLCKPIVQLGGWKHPFHQPVEKYWSGFIKGVGRSYEVDAVTGNCFVIRYSDWKKYGPFDANALGPGQSEDYALSQKIKTGGGIVATLDPPVAIHCGLANCLGEPATGWVEMAAMAEKQITENNIDKVWLATPDEGTILLERVPRSNFSGLNVGSGQRRFDASCGWHNIDTISRPPDQIPDIVLDAKYLDTKFAEKSQDIVVLHHVLEHFGCGEADEVIKQCYKVLRPGGSLLIFVPDLRKLAGRWLNGELNTYLFMANTYGAYQGEEGDRHKWGYDSQSLYDYVKSILFQDNSRNHAYWGKWIKPFDWREIPGADIAKDWWVLGMEVIK